MFSMPCSLTQDQKERCALRDAAALVALGWCQTVPARDSYGLQVSPAQDMACYFCLLGALSRATMRLSADDRPWVFHGCLDRLGRCLPAGTNLVFWNDVLGRTQYQVVELLCRAADPRGGGSNAQEGSHDDSYG